MKNVFILLTVFIILLPKSTLLSQNVAINSDGTAPNASAMLDVKSTTKGLLIPRMTSLQRTAILTPAQGLTVFDINTKSFHVFNGTAWTELASVNSNYWLTSGTNIYNNNAGFVGIGTNLPFARLHIKGNEASVVLRIQNTLPEGYADMQFGGSSTTAIAKIGYANAAAPTLTNSFYVGSTGYIPFIFTTASVERMRISTQGYVGIGTTAPTSRLHIIGNEASVPFRIQNSLATGYGGMQFHNSAGVLMGQIGFANAAAPTFTNSFYAGSIGTASFILTTKNLERMRIDSTGNIGIGTVGAPPNASAMLDIKSINKGVLIPRMTLAQRNLIALPATGLLIYQTDNTPGFYFYNGTTWVPITSGGSSNSWSLNGNNIFNTNTGNAGVGTSNPINKFTVQSAYDSYGITHTDGTIKISTYIGKGGGAWFGTQSNHKLHIYTNGNGTPNITFHPEFYTDIRGKKPWVRFYDETNGFNLSGDIRANGSNLEIAAFKVPGAGSGTPGNLILQANDAIGLGSIAGNVGIGTSAPDFKLTIKSTLVQSNTNTHVLRLIGQNPVLSLSDGVAGYGYIKAWTYQPYAPFTKGLVLGADPGQAIFLSTNYGATMTIASNDNVGIGTTNPAHKLSVNGTIQSKEVIVETGWADYVFDKKYKLLSLEEVEKFILQNYHLPNIPSAKEMEEKGLSVGDTQRRMMEKIEELTLYVIELKKEIEKLKAR